MAVFSLLSEYSYKSLCEFKQTCIKTVDGSFFEGGGDFLKKIMIYSSTECFLKAIILFQLSGLVFTKVRLISRPPPLLGVVMFFWND